MGSWYILRRKADCVNQEYLRASLENHQFAAGGNFLPTPSHTSKLAMDGAICRSINKASCIQNRDTVWSLSLA